MKITLEPGDIHNALDDYLRARFPNHFIDQDTIEVLIGIADPAQGPFHLGDIHLVAQLLPNKSAEGGTSNG